MSSQNIRKMVLSALLIALGIVFQQLRFVLGDTIVTTYIISSLVNLCLIVAATLVGLWSGMAVAVVTPLIAFAQGHAILPMVPWIIAGNAVLVAFYALFAVKNQAPIAVLWPRWAITGVIAALVKFAVIAFGMYLMVTHSVAVAALKQYVQIVTAVIAMILGGIILPMLPKKAARQ